MIDYRIYRKGGIFTCDQCTYCPWVQTGSKFWLPNGEWFHPRFHATCNKEGVVYLMTFRCGAFYVGKTICQIKQCLYDHIYYSQFAKMLTFITDFTPRWFISLCQRLYLRTHVAAIGINAFSKRETLWIERLDPTKPPGINEVLSYRPFL